MCFFFAFIAVPLRVFAFSPEGVTLEIYMLFHLTELFYNPVEFSLGGLSGFFRKRVSVLHDPATRFVLFELFCFPRGYIYIYQIFQKRQ